LTGYVPEDVSLEDSAMPLADRPTLIGYRGRRLPHHYGLLGREKYLIGVEVRDRAVSLGLPVDIEVEDSHRIYGNDWYRFLGSCRATLGTESGANVFDESGELKRLSALHDSMSYEAFAEKYLGFHEGRVRMNQISPKIFEAIRLRTALILFEGRYSGIVEPDVHYIPLKRDLSNFTEVVEKIRSLEYLQKLTERAYRDIIESGRWSYRTFAEDFSRYLSRRLLGRPPRARLVAAPILAFQGHESPSMLWPHALMNGLASGQILDHRLGRRAILSAVGSPRGPSPAFTLDTRRAWQSKTLHESLRKTLKKMNIPLLKKMNVSIHNSNSFIRRLLRTLWRILPKRVRYTLGPALRRLVG